MLGQREGRGDGLGGVLEQGVERVDVEVVVVRHIRGDTVSGVPAHVLQRVLQPREVVQVLQGRRAVETRINVQGLHRRAACAEVDGITAHGDRPCRIASVQGKDLGRGVDGFLDQRSREQEPPARVSLRAASQQRLGQIVRHLAHAQLFEQAQRRVVDRHHVSLGERPVRTAGLAGWAGVNLRLGSTRGHAFFAARTAGRRRLGLKLAHAQAS